MLSCSMIWPFSLLPRFRPTAAISSLPSINLEEARKRARILVIDDDPAAFPLSGMENEGYTVRHWSEVKSYQELESGEYDIIVLDIHGIAPDLPGNSGVAVLEHIKRYNPAQIVIAFSGKKYDIKQGAFFKLADDVMMKPAYLMECKQKIDDLLRSRFSVGHYWAALKFELEKRGVSHDRIKNLESEIVAAAKANKAPDEYTLEKTLKTTKEVVTIVSTIVGIILRIAAA